MTPIEMGIIPKHSDFVTGFSPLITGAESREMRKNGFRPYQTSTKRKDKEKYRVQVEEDSDESSSSEYTEDEQIPRRKKINYKKSRSQSRERRSSSHQREHDTLGGRTFLTCPGLVFNPGDFYLENFKGPGQKIIKLACGPTADEILDMPGTSSKAKSDMLAEQLDCMQKSLCYFLLEGKKKDKQEPTINDVWKLREATHDESPPNKGKAPRKQKKFDRDSSKNNKAIRENRKNLLTLSPALSTQIQTQRGRATGKSYFLLNHK